jgi:hypothetical protein
LLPGGFGALERSPVAAVGVLGVVGGHPGRQFPVERVGQDGDVAQCRGLGGSLGERVVLQAVVGDRIGDGDGAVEQLAFGDESLEQSKVDGLLGGAGLAEQ